MNSTRLIRYGLSLLLLIFAPITHSETTVPPTDDEQTEVVELDTVTVEGEGDEGDKLYNAKYSTSATRTDAPIKAIPQSVQVVTRKLINDQQNVTVSETLRNVSGLIPNNVLYTPAVESTRIRGFLAEQLLDGFTQYYNPGDRESTNNLERIEVLKGSNAVLYSGGSGSPVGGVVNMVSKLPKANAFGQFGMRLGSEDFYQPSIDVNQPINDKVLTRFTGEYTNAGSFLDVIETQRYNLNEAITFTNNDSTNFTIQGRIAKWQQQEYQGLPATGTVTGDFKIRPELFIGPDDIPPSHSDYYGIWGTLDHWFNDTWSVNAKARYSESEFNQLAQIVVGEGQNFTADIPLIGSIWGLRNTELFQQQVEKSFLFNVLAQFDYGHSQNKVLFGADYSVFEDQGFTISSQNIPINFASTDLASANPQFQPYLKTWPGTHNLFVTNTTYGGYAQLQSDWYERLHLLFSLRAGVVQIDYLDQTINPGTILTSETRLLPRAGAVYDLTKSVSLFVNYSEGMRGQPFTQFREGDKPVPALSESLEAGFKFDVAEQLTGQMAVYQIDRSNVAVSAFENSLRSIPSGKQRSRGFEVDLVYRPLPELQLLGNYAYTDAVFTNDLAPGIPSGSKLFGVPDHSTRLWANYDFSKQHTLSGLSMGAGVYWQSETFLSNRNLFKSDSYYTFDASIAYQYQRYKLAATVKNLTNEFYYQSFGYLGGRVAPAQGTSAFVNFTVNF